MDLVLNNINKTKTQEAMLKQQSQCCLCRQPFTTLSQPRMMPHCQHSSCSHCLKHFISEGSKIVCKLCGRQELCGQVDLQYFPKNIILNKKLKEKVTFQFKKEEGGVDTEESLGAAKERNFCDVHNMQLEIVCMTDRTRICPHCALFSSHRQHNLKTVKDLSNAMQKMQEEFQGCRSRKALIDGRMEGQEYKEKIVARVTEHKNKLIIDIRKKFSGLIDNIKLAEKNVYEDLAKKFKLMNQRIGELMREENEVQREYKVWQHKCRDVIKRADKCRKIEEKMFYYFNGPMDLCLKGDGILKELERKIDCQLENIEEMIGKIAIKENLAVPNTVFNYLNVVIQNQEQIIESINTTPSTSVAVTPKRIRTEECNISVQSCSEPLIKEPESPKKRTSCISGEKTRDRSVLKRRASRVQELNMDVEEIVTEFCQKQMDTLDLSGQGLADLEVVEVLLFLKKIKKVKGLKLVRNKLTTEGLVKILQHLPAVTNLNLSYNQLTDDSINQLLGHYSKVPQLRIVNLSNNKINQRRSKNIIEHLKRQGVIVTL